MRGMIISPLKMVFWTRSLAFKTKLLSAGARAYKASSKREPFIVRGGVAFISDCHAGHG